MIQWHLVHSTSCTAITSTQILKIVIILKRKCAATKAVTPCSVFLTNLLSISVDLAVLGILYKWNPTIPGLYVWWVWCSIMLVTFPRVVACISPLFLFMTKYNSTVWLEPPLVCPLVGGLVSAFVSCEQCYCKHSRPSFAWTWVPVLWRIEVGAHLLSHLVMNSVSNSLRKAQAFSTAGAPCMFSLSF